MGRKKSREEEWKQRPPTLGMVEARMWTELGPLVEEYNRLEWANEQTDGVDECEWKHWREVLKPAMRYRMGELDYIYALRLFSIEDKNADKVIFDPKPAQLQFLEEIRKQEVAGVPVRGIGLKARQVGFSTIVSLWMYRKLRDWPGAWCMCVSHNKGSAARISRMYELANLRDESPSFRPMPRAYGDLLFPDEFGGGGVNIFSSWRDSTANSFTFQLAHMDEVAKWPRAPLTALASMIQCISMTNPNTAILLISTADGYNSFRDMWLRKDDGFFRYFSPWFDDPEYVVPFKTGRDRYKFEESMTSAEIECRALYHLSLEQMAWRRMKLQSLEYAACPQLFSQDYPSEPDEAFLGSGIRYFNFPLDIYIRNVQDIDIRRDFSFYTYTGEEIVMHGEGKLCVYAPPEKGHTYVAGLDPSEFRVIENEENRHDPDNAVIEVFDVGPRDENGNRMMIQVAEYVSRMEPFHLVDVTIAVCDWYNRAYLFFERNAAGAGMKIALVEKYGDHLMRQCVPLKDNKRVDYTKQAALGEYGWHTNKNSRKTLLIGIRQVLFDGTIMISSQRLLDQILHFKGDDSGAGYMDGGKHDDELFAMGLAIQVVQHPDFNPQNPIVGFFKDEELNQHVTDLGILNKLQIGESHNGMTVVP